MSAHAVSNALALAPATAKELMVATGLSRGFVNATLLDMVKAHEAHVSHVQRQPGVAGRPSPVYQAGFDCTAGAQALARVMRTWGSPCTA
jgi:hypothetical protein